MDTLFFFFPFFIILQPHVLLLQGSGGYGINLGSRTTNMIIHGDEHIRIYSPSKKQQIQRVPNDSDYAASRDDMKDDQSPIPSGRRFCSGACFRIFVLCLYRYHQNIFTIILHILFCFMDSFFYFFYFFFGNTVCGSSLWNYDAKWPTYIHPAAGTIDDPLPLVPPGKHVDIFTAENSAANWAHQGVDQAETTFVTYPNMALSDWHEKMGMRVL